MIQKRIPVIHTQRLCLHALAEQDADALIALFKNEAIGKTYMVPELDTREAETRLFSALQKLSGAEDRFVYGIYLENALIGFINDVEICESRIELGFVIHPAHQNKGYASEVLSASMEALFSLGYSVVKTGAFEENAASIRVMEKCGMTRLDGTDEIEYRG